MIVKIVNQSNYPLPKYATSLSAGMDLNANIDAPIELKSLERVMIPTGLFIELPQGYEAQIRPRSGLAAKYGITVANAPGTIDADYRGEIKVVLVNLSKESFTIKPGERIAQMVIAKFTQIQWNVVDKLTDTLRGDGGFGSTGLGIKATTISISKLTNKKGKADIFKLYMLYQKTNGICTDSRKVQQGDMFFALKGDNFDGNNFVLQALESGAAYAIADNEQLVKEAKKKFPKRLIIVDNSLKTLQQLAKHHRLQFKIPVIGITGTNGKTTTKELIKSVLSTKYNVVATEGNLNNDIGVPLTLFRINKQTEVAIIEMGASHPNDIATLVSIVCPSFGLITSIGKAHLQGFGSLEGVKKAKGELYDNLMEYKKIAFVNIDNPILAEMIEKRPELQIVPYGIKNNCVIIKEGNASNPYLSFSMPYMSGEEKEKKKIVVKTNLIGNYNADNVLAALCIATHFAIPTKNAIKAIAEYTPSNNRSQLEKTKSNTIIKDAYNANPTSMGVAIKSFGEIVSKNPKMLILGDMLELGKDSQKEHKNIIEEALSIKPKSIFFVGGEFAKGCKELYNKKAKCMKGVTFTSYKEIKNKKKSDKEKESSNTSIILFETVEQVIEYINSKPIKKNLIFVKGSHGIHLEKLFGVI